MLSLEGRRRKCLAGTYLTLMSLGFAISEVHAQAIPFTTLDGSSSARTPAASGTDADASNAQAAPASRGDQSNAASSSGAGSSASQGYVGSDDSSNSKLRGEPDSSAELGKSFAHVMRVVGDVAASAKDSDEVRHLTPGDSVLVGDHLQSSGGGEVLLQATDASMIALRPASELWIESYAANGSADDHMVLRLVQGGARVASGWIPHVNTAGSQVLTATTAIGAGDSDHEIFVVSSELANSDRERPGTYDKVNRGSSVLRAANQDLEIQVGHVGFVGAAPPSTTHAHTVLLPLSLDKVPPFYARGAFDSEMDNYVKDIDRTSDAMLQRQLGNVTLSAAVCDPSRAGKAWLRSLDVAIARRDVAKVQTLFAAEARFSVSVADSLGANVSRDVDRTAFLTEYLGIPSASSASLQRLSTTFEASPDTRRGGCAEVVVQSIVAQRVVLQGKPSRSQSADTYHLAMIGDAWLAVSAHRNSSP